MSSRRRLESGHLRLSLPLVSTHLRSPHSPLLVPHLSRALGRPHRWRPERPGLLHAPVRLEPKVEEDKVVFCLGPFVSFNLYHVFLCLGKTADNPL
jgi:hypothetical protein